MPGYGMSCPNECSLIERTGAPEVMLKKSANMFFLCPPLVGLFCVVLTAINAGAQDESAVRGKLSKGLRALKEYRLEEAVESLEEAVNISPTNAYARWSLGKALLVKGEPVSAIEQFNEAIRLDPADVGSYWDRGAAKAATGDAKGAINDFSVAVRMQPENTDIYIDRARARFGSGDTQGAFADISMALEIDERSSQAYYMRSQFREALGDNEGAFEDMSAAAILGAPRAMTALGRMYYVGRGCEQSFTEARHWFERAVAAGDKDAELDLGLLYLKGVGGGRDYTRALDHIQRAAKAGDLRAITTLGILLKTGEGGRRDYAKALELLRKAADSGSPEAMLHLGLMYRDGEGIGQNMDLAREWLAKAKDAGSARAAEALGNIETGPAPQAASKPARRQVEETREPGNSGWPLPALQLVIGAAVISAALIGIRMAQTFRASRERNHKTRTLPPKQVSLYLGRQTAGAWRSAPVGEEERRPAPKRRCEPSILDDGWTMEYGLNPEDEELPVAEGFKPRPSGKKRRRAIALNRATVRNSGFTGTDIYSAGKDARSGRRRRTRGYSAREAFLYKSAPEWVPA